jgi:urease gamma subunit|tara:strand:- start:215 stop:328 length:114 start_codon:yes stop_codon:yes gene_type:complete
MWPHPTEQERLTIFITAQRAREHLSRGIKFSQPEAAA